MKTTTNKMQLFPVVIVKWKSSKKYPLECTRTTLKIKTQSNN